VLSAFYATVCSIESVQQNIQNKYIVLMVKLYMSIHMQ
jgi:hypothetical protein